MLLRLRVIEGLNRGAEYATTDQGCILVGRDSAGSQANFRLNPRDRFVSRNHFLLEFQPPNCYIRDNGSRNGTLVKGTNDTQFRRIAAGRLGDGDQIRVGDTLLSVFLGVNRDAEEAVVCVECGADITLSLVSRRTGEISYLDFVCPGCREALDAGAAAADLPAGTFLCARCGKDLSSTANRDRRALLLGGAASYLCDSCVPSARHEADAREIRDYLVLEEIGRGAMGVVSKAWHGPTGRLVALKTILPDCAMAEKASRAFQREMAVMRTLRHPNIVRLLDHGMFEGEHFLVSEHVPDGNAEALLGSVPGRRLEPPRACRIICQVLEGVGYAHDRGFIHRDIKPKNILLRRGDGGEFEAKLSDFGLAKSYTKAGQSGITRVGESGGTLFFMAPEQITDYRHVRPPADLYSVGVSLYFLLTGLLPFDVPSPIEQVRGMLSGKIRKDPLLAVLEDKPVPVLERNPGLPRGIAEIVDKAVRKAASRRYRSAGDFRRDLALASGVPLEPPA